MNNELNTDMETKWREHKQRSQRGRMAAGLLLMLVGAGVLLRNSGMLSIPHWLFSWPMILIGIGLVSGIKHNFKKPNWMIIVIIGSIFLYDKAFPGSDLGQYIFPVGIIILGLFFILKPKNNQRKWEKMQGKWSPRENEFDDVVVMDSGDTMDINAVFAGVKKNILSKNFRGGEITTFMGGAEVNFMQADFKGRITIDANNIFGGTKLIIPPNWNVQSEINAIFGGVEDKRQISNVTVDPDKVIVLDGNCVFGGIEIRSY